MGIDRVSCKDESTLSESLATGTPWLTAYCSLSLFVQRCAGYMFISSCMKKVQNIVCCDGLCPLLFSLILFSLIIDRSS